MEGLTPRADREQPAYLEPNRNSLQKTRRGEGSLLAFSGAKSMLKKPRQAYLEPVIAENRGEGSSSEQKRFNATLVYIRGL
jgi:hypothetical protein